MGELGEPKALLAQTFIAAIEALGQDLSLPRRLAELRKTDIPALAKAACREADTNYPVPRYMSEADCEKLIANLLPRATSRSRKT